MTIDQMAKALQDVGACFAVTTAKTILPNDGFDAKPSYHIHPDCSYPYEKNIVRVYSQVQFQDWIRTVKAAQRATDQAAAYDLWLDYGARWDK